MEAADWKYATRMVIVGIIATLILLLAFVGCEVVEHNSKQESYRVCIQSGGEVISNHCIKGGN